MPGKDTKSPRILTSLTSGGHIERRCLRLRTPNVPTKATTTTVAVAGVPEPSTFALATLTLLGIAWLT